MPLPGDFRKAFVNLIESSWSQQDFKDFISGSDIGILFEDTQIDVATYPVNLGRYVDEIYRQSKTGRLIELILAERPSERATLLNEQYLEIFENHQENAKFKLELFRKQILHNQSVLFIYRDFFADGLARMINRDDGTLLGLKGISQSGVTYIRNYLGEVVDQMKLFKFVDLNLKDIGEKYATETVSDAHLGEIICQRLNMTSPGLVNFKLAPFLNSLETKLEELAEKGEKWLFFIDQFDYPHTKEVKVLLRMLAKMLITHPNMFYLLFYMYDKWQQDWTRDEINLANEMEFKPFTPEQVNEYLEKLFEIVKKRYTGDENKFPTKEAFIVTATDRLKPEYYDTSKGSNVPVISDELKIWFRNLKNDLRV